MTDITRREQMQPALRRTNSTLEEFTYAAAHDLKSPLHGIAELVEWIAEDLGDAQTPEVARNLGRVRDRVRRLDRVIDDLLAYAHAGIASTDAVRVDAAALIENVLELLPAPAGFRISIQIDATPFVTHKAPLECVLRNLVDNAIKHHDRSSGHIALQVRDVGRYCVFSVSDDGPGIAPASPGRAFSDARPGIGLALAQRMVEAHGGWLKLESVAGVRGTAFHVGWPRLQGHESDD